MQLWQLNHAPALSGTMQGTEEADRIMAAEPVTDEEFDRIKKELL